MVAFMRLLLLFFVSMVMAISTDSTHVCGQYEPLSKVTGGLVRTSFMIKGEKEISSVTEIIESFSINYLINENYTYTASLQKISSINNIKLSSPTIGEPWFDFRLNTHTVLLTLHDDISLMNTTCSTPIQINIPYNVSEITCFYHGEDILSSFKQLVQTDASLQSAFLFNGNEMYFGTSIYKRTSSEGCQSDYGWSLLVIIGIILVLLLIVALIVMTVLYVKLRITFKARATFLPETSPLV